MLSLMPRPAPPLPDQIERFIEQAQQDGCEPCGSGDVTVGDELLFDGGYFLPVWCASCGKRTRRPW